MEGNAASAIRRSLRGALIASAVGFVIALLVTNAVGVFELRRLMGRHAMYWLAAATGALVGLVLGNPVWRKDAGLEGAIKAAFGAFAACALLYALRNLLPSQFGLGGVVSPSQLAKHPGVLPLITAPLGALFAFDHDEPSRVRVEATAFHLRVHAASESAVEDETPGATPVSARSGAS